MSRRRRKDWTTRADPGRPRFLLRNVHPMRMDVSLGDLGYRIPYGQTRDLLDPRSGLRPEDVARSRRENGSVWKRLGQKVLMEVRAVPDLRPPSFSVAKASDVVFPQRVRSLQVVDVAEADEEIRSSILADDDELLKEMEGAGEDGKDAGPPLTADEDKEDA